MHCYISGINVGDGVVIQLRARSKKPDSSRNYQDVVAARFTMETHKIKSGGRYYYGIADLSNISMTCPTGTKMVNSLPKATMPKESSTWSCGLDVSGDNSKIKDSGSIGYSTSYEKNAYTIQRICSESKNYFDISYNYKPTCSISPFDNTINEWLHDEQYQGFYMFMFDTPTNKLYSSIKLNMKCTFIAAMSPYSTWEGAPWRVGINSYGSRALSLTLTGCKY